MKKRAKAMLAIVSLAVCVALTGCQSGNGPAVAQTVATDNTDPRNGWVVVVPYNESGSEWSPVSVLKRCDGTTLIYLTPGNGSGAHGISALPDSPECSPSPATE